MLVLNSFQFRPRSTGAQAKLLQAQLDACRWLCDELFSQITMAYETWVIPLIKYPQLLCLPIHHEEPPSVEAALVQVGIVA